MSAVRFAYRFLLVFAAFGGLPVLQAATPPLVIKNGEARAERVKEFSGVLDLLKLEEASKERASTPRVGFTMPSSVMMTQQDLEALFEAWMLGKPPKIDFSKQVLTVVTWGGSQIQVLRFIDEKGNLSVNCAGGSKDIVAAPSGGRGVTYCIEVYTLTNVKSVNGQKWPSVPHEAERDAPQSDPAQEGDSKTGEGSSSLVPANGAG